MVTGILTARLATAGLQDQVIVQSAGLQALVGRPAIDDVVHLLAGRGIDISQHRATQLQEADVINADLVLVMEERHRRKLFYVAPESLHKVVLLSELAGEHLDLVDPFGSDHDAYAATLRRIETVLDQGWTKLLDLLQLRPSHSLREAQTLEDSWSYKNHLHAKPDGVQVGAPARPLGSSESSYSTPAQRWRLAAVLLLLLAAGLWIAWGPLRQTWLAQNQAVSPNPASVSPGAGELLVTAVPQALAGASQQVNGYGQPATPTPLLAAGGAVVPSAMTTVARNPAAGLVVKIIEPQPTRESARITITTPVTPVSTPAVTATHPPAATATPEPSPALQVDPQTVASQLPALTPTATLPPAANPTVVALRTRLSQRVAAIALVLSVTPTASPLATTMPASTPTLTAALSTTVTAPLLIGPQSPALTRTWPDKASGDLFVLLEPAEPSIGGEWQVRWHTNLLLAEGEAFELVFWQVGQDPLKDGVALAAPTTDSSVNVNLASLDSQQAKLLQPGYYRYGVLLVRLAPYQRLRALGMSLPFRSTWPAR